MPKALSMDLRERVVAAQKESRSTYDEMAARFGIGRATFNRWVNRWRKTGSVAPMPHDGGQPRKVELAQMNVIAELITEKPDATRAELAASLAKRTGVQVSVAQSRSLAWKVFFFETSPTQLAPARWSARE